MAIQKISRAHHLVAAFFVIVATSVTMMPRAWAASVKLIPDSAVVALGGQLTLQIVGDFDGDATLGGGMDLSFEEGDLDFVSFTPSGIGVEEYSRDPDVDAGALAGFAFGDFNGIGANGILLGTIVFDVPEDANQGASNISITVSAGVAGPFASAKSFTRQQIEFSDATVTITDTLFSDAFEAL